MSAAQPDALRDGRRLCIQGTVQGVGFRPWVHRLAREEGLCGSVRNDAAGVVVEVFGPPAALARLRRRLEREAPAAARVREIREERIGGPGPRGFSILASGRGAARRVSIPPEHSENLVKLREALKSQGLEAALISNPFNITWLAGYAPSIQTGPSPFEGGPALGWFHQGELTVLLTDWEAGPAGQTEVNVFPYVGYTIDEPLACAQRMSAALGEMLKPFAGLQGTVGIEMNHLPAALYPALQAALPGASLRNLDRQLDPLRAVKTDEEIQKIRAAPQLCDLAQFEIKKHIQPGMTELELWQRVKSKVELEAGGQSTIMKPLNDLLVEIGTRLELFVDDHLVERMTGVAFRLHEPVQQPLAKSPLITVGYMTILKDGDVYRAYYVDRIPGYDGPGGDGNPGEITCCAESRDGIEWTFPDWGVTDVVSPQGKNVILYQPPFNHNFSPFLHTRPRVEPIADDGRIVRTRLTSAARMPVAASAPELQPGLEGPQRHGPAVSREAQQRRQGRDGRPSHSARRRRISVTSRARARSSPT